MSQFIDRRDRRYRSALNRQRFMQRFKQQIRRAVTEAIKKRSIHDLIQ